MQKKSRWSHAFATLSLFVPVTTATAAVNSPFYINETSVRNISVTDAIPSSGRNIRKLVSMKILLGGNPCVAKGMQPIIEARHENGALNLYPKTIRSMAKTPEICTTEWNPVYTSYQIEVTGDRDQLGDLLLHNVDNQGDTLTVERLD